MSYESRANPGLGDPTLPPDEVVRRGREIYERAIRAQVEPVHTGKFLVINVLTGEYELDTDDALASRRARERFNGAPLCTMRIGHRAAYHFGGRKKTPASAPGFVHS